MAKNVAIPEHGGHLERTGALDPGGLTLAIRSPGKRDMGSAVNVLEVAVHLPTYLLLVAYVTPLWNRRSRLASRPFGLRAG